jgi:hypothetical protein
MSLAGALESKHSRYTQYKKLYRVSLFGDDDTLASNTNSAYAAMGSTFTNGKRMIFNLNTVFNNVKLSSNARLVLESCNLPTITGVSDYVLLRLVAGTEDIAFDSHKFTMGNPLICTFKSSNQTIMNNDTTLYTLQVPNNFLSKNVIELEIEVPNATSNIDFLTGSPLKNFYLTFVIIDTVEEETEDNTLRPVVSKKYIRDANKAPMHIT